jgi:uncharacterized membrane protein HdeD (DUF308 family)
MPKPRDLPDMMKDLAFRQATEVDMRRDFHSHMDRLIRVMDQLLAKANSESAATDAEGVKAESDKSGEALTEQQEAPRRKAVEATKAKTGTPPRRALKDGSEPSGGAASDLVWVASVHAAVLEYRTWFNILGIVLVSLGVVAIVCAVVSTAPAVLTLLLAIVGIVQIGHALATRQWCGFPLDLIIGVLYLIVAGLWDLWPYIPALPASGALSLMFIIQGMLEAGMAYRLHPHAGWVWMLLAGIVALAVGVLGIFARGVAAIAICLAITLITSGIAYLLVPLPTRGQA